MALMDVVVSQIVEETPTIKSFYFSKPDGTPMGTYTPGAHIDIVGPTAITRQYSLCSRPDAGDSFAVAVKREDPSRGGSTAMHDLQVGDRVKISEPRNLLSIANEAAHHILIAAGIGITPMLSMARYMHVRGVSFELHYFARAEEDAAFLPLLRERCPEKLHAHFGIERTHQDTILSTAFSAADPTTHVYVCGPEGFMRKVVSIAEQHFPSTAIHFENFHATAQPDSTDNAEFEVELEGQTYQIPSNKSIAEVLEEQGCEIDTSCQEGICGTCIMQVLDGQPDHRDSVLTKSEKDSGKVITACVSRAKTNRLVLDYY